MSRRQSTLRVAQLSFWFVHSQQFCSLAKSTENVELVTCWDDNLARGSNNARHWGISFEPDLERLLARDDIDAVSICGEPYLNSVLVEAAAKAGKAILVEKVMAPDLKSAERMIHTVEENQVAAMPAFNLRYHPVAEAIKEMVESGELGRLSRVRRLHGHSLAYENRDFDGGRIMSEMNWVDPVAEKRAALFFSGSHTALWFIWMFGPPKYVQAMATTSTSFLPVQDNAIILMEWPNGMIGTMESSETVLAQGPVTEIYGLDGVVLQYSGNLPATRVWNRDFTPLRYFNRRTAEWKIPSLPPEFLRHEARYSSPGVFFQCLLKGSELPMNLIDGYNSIAILVAAEEALKRHERVDVGSWSDAK